MLDVISLTVIYIIDIGEGNSVLALTRGTGGGEHLMGFPDPDYHTSLHNFHGKLEVWRYAGGQAEQVATAHEVRWKADAGFVCVTRVGGMLDENGEPLPDPDVYLHYLDFTEDAYSVEGGGSPRPPFPPPMRRSTRVRGPSAAAL